jgi:hypothetical protein
MADARSTFVFTCLLIIVTACFPDGAIIPCTRSDIHFSGSDLAMRTGTGTWRDLLHPLLVVCLLIGMVPAHAEVTLKDYALLKGSERLKLHLEGVVSGFQQANSELQLRHVKRLYCLPAKTTLQFENYLQILEKEVQDNASFYTPDSSIESALLFGLMKNYPCR